MKAYYKQGWGISFLVMGAVLLVLNFMVMNMGGSSARVPMGLITAAFVTLAGIMYLTQPAFELREKELVLFNLFGMEIRRHAFNSLNDFQVIDGKIYISTEGKSKRVRISRTMVKTQDWDAFMRKITAGDLSRELHNI